MMIHDAFVEVTCDGVKCNSSEWVGLEFVYTNYSGRGGHYDHDDKKIESSLVENFEWTVVDSKHYCCPECEGVAR